MADVSSGGLYSDSSLLTAIQYDQFGISDTSFPWTGSTVTGTPNGSKALGSTNGTTGDSGGTNPGWLNGVSLPKTDFSPVFALSGPITSAAPEPSSCVLLVAGMATVGFVTLRKKYRRA